MRRVLSIAALTGLLVALMLSFGASVAFADKCEPDDRGPGPGGGHDEWPFDLFRAFDDSDRGPKPECPEPPPPTSPPTTAAPAPPATPPATTPPTAAPVPAPAPPVHTATAPTAAAPRPARAAAPTRTPASAARRPTPTDAVADPTPPSEPVAVTNPAPAASVAAPPAPTSTTTPSSDLALALARDSGPELEAGPTLVPTIAFLALGALTFALLYWLYVTVLGRR